jgi:L-alanine-DL-glutamate epimerase-like enolase superfamily enzyme
MQRPKITDIRATTITVPLEAPLRHSNGAHWGRFVRTIVEVETDVGITGLGEMGGGGESAEAAFKALKSYLDCQPLQQPDPDACRARIRLHRHYGQVSRRPGL